MTETDKTPRKATAPMTLGRALRNGVKDHRTDTEIGLRLGDTSPQINPRNLATLL
jgi:hypothetical protein